MIKRIKYLEVLPVVFISLLIYFAMSSPSLLQRARSILQPLLWAGAISYVLRPAANWFHQKLRWRWSWTVLLTYLIFTLVIGSLFFWLVPLVVANITEFIGNIPKIVSSLTALLNEIFQRLQDTPFGSRLENFDFSDIISRLTTLTGNTLNYFSSLLLDSIQGLFKIFMGFVISIYLLLSKERVKETSARFLRVKTDQNQRNKVYHFLNKADKIFSNFLVGKIIDSTIIGIIAFVGFSIIGVPYVVLMSLVVGVTNVIPYFGPFIGGIPVVFLTLLSDPLKALWAGIFILLLQQFDGNYLGPKILGNTIGISAFWVILGVLIGGGMFGVVGMFLGVPAIALIHSEFKAWLHRQDGGGVVE